MFSLPRMLMIVLGSVVLLLLAMTWYIGYNDAVRLVGKVPGYEVIRHNPAIAGCGGAVLILLAFLVPAEKRRTRHDWTEGAM